MLCKYNTVKFVAFFFDELSNNSKVGKLDPLPENISIWLSHPSYKKTSRWPFKIHHHIRISIPSAYKNSLDYEKLLVFFVWSAKGQREVTNAANKIFVQLHELSLSGKKYVCRKNTVPSPSKKTGPTMPVSKWTEIFTYTLQVTDFLS